MILHSYFSNVLETKIDQQFFSKSLSQRNHLLQYFCRNHLLIYHTYNPIKKSCKWLPKYFDFYVKETINMYIKLCLYKILSTGSMRKHTRNKNQNSPNHVTFFISSGEENCFPVWSKAPVRRTYSVLSARELTQWPCPCHNAR